MEKFALKEQKRYFFRFNIRDVDAPNKDLNSVLHQLMLETDAQSAIIYRNDDESEEFRAIAGRSVLAPRIPELGVTIGRHATSVLRASTEPFQTLRADDDRFTSMPEFLQYRLLNLLFLPLRTADLLLGFLNLGRTIADPFRNCEIEAALPIANVVAAVLERDHLQNALRKRKLVERAKGLIQRHRQISEEEAYLILRNQSRRARRPMALIAEGIINQTLLGKTA